MGTIVEINGPLVIARLPGVPNGEQVRVGELGLTGEIRAIPNDRRRREEVARLGIERVVAGTKGAPMGLREALESLLSHSR